MNACGECTLCCKLLAVTELNKPAGVWCQHVVRWRGCSIYADRPAACREFSCVWLEAQLPEDLKPDRSHVVLATPEWGAVVAHVDPNYQGAAVKGPMGRFLDRLVAGGVPVAIMEGDGRRLRYRSESDLSPAVRAAVRRAAGG